MKILYLTTDSHLAGTEKNILNLIRFMHQKGHKVELMTLMGNGELVEAANEIGIHAGNLSMNKNNILDYIKLKEALKGKKYDIIHSFLFHANILSRLFKPKGTILINSFRSEDKWKKWYHYLLEKVTVKRVDRFTINFPQFNEYKSKHGIKNNIVYIPNGISIKQDNYSQFNPFIVKLVGRFHAVKQHIPLMQNYLLSRIRNENIKFRFIGRGPLKNEIENFIFKMGLKNNFEIVDFTEDEKSIYSGTSVVVCVSKYEGFPNTLLEANSYAIPILSFNVGAAVDIIENGKNGFLVRDFDELFDRLLQLKKNADKYSMMSMYAKKIATSRFLIENINMQYLKLYKEVMKDQ